MNRSSALGGVLLLLCACSAPDPDAPAQQLTPTAAVAANDQQAPVAENVSTPVATPAIPDNRKGATAMDANKQEQAALLRSSFEACIARSGGATPYMQDCIAAEAVYQDGRLASAYGTLRATLSPVERQTLESEQNAWLAERENVCAWNAAEEGQGQRLDADGCALEMTARRATQLEARLQGR